MGPINHLYVLPKRGGGGYHFVRVALWELWLWMITNQEYLHQGNLYLEYLYQDNLHQEYLYQEYLYQEYLQQEYFHKEYLHQDHLTW